jgi:hypothetical protein
MASQINSREEFDRRLLRVIDLVQTEFGLTDHEIDALIYNSVFYNDLSILCGDPDYGNYN